MLLSPAASMRHMHLFRFENNYLTPYPVVSFIVRSIHEILKEKFGKPFGLADETVKILDPAAGTGVFLIASARMAIDEIARKYGNEKAHNLVRQYMLNNFCGN